MLVWIIFSLHNVKKERMDDTTSDVIKVPPTNIIDRQVSDTVRDIGRC